MKNAEALERENAALRERLHRLSEASLRINESLDFDNVLQEVVDGARALTGARYGVITTVDDSGQPQDFVTSGLSPEEHRRFMDLPSGPQFFEYLSNIRESLRLRDFHSHTRALGLPEFRPPMPVSAVLSFLGAPIRHRGEWVGAIYVGENEQEFTREDEETLVMFASQAALVIANARRHREEQWARAGLETLIDTSPVGVLVMDGRTGALVSVNREALRLVSSLVEPGGSVEQLLDVVTIERADGTEMPLAELSMAQAMSSGETVRVEEIVIRLPDGRSVTTLMNATPILSDAGEVESFVVTLQDLAALDELDRSRVEFLGMVSHELQAPLASIRGSATILLNDGPDLDPAEMRQFFRIIEQEAGRMRSLISELLDLARVKTGTMTVAPSPVEVSNLVDEARNAFLNAGGRNTLQIDLPPGLPWIAADRARMVQVLGNLFNNAARYSPESSPIRVTAVRNGVLVEVSVADEGRGIPPERLPNLFGKFFRLDSDDQEPGVGDTGLGLAICKGIVEAHGGRIWAESDGLGLGSRFTFTIPAIEEPTVGPAAERARRSASSGPSESELTRILVVDDDPQALRYVRDVLSRAGYAPTVTGDPAEALRMMEEEHAHLALLDLMLPGSSGIELMQDILSIAQIPVIFLSAYGQDDIIARAFDMGAADYVVKPFSPTELAARIRAALRRRESDEQNGPGGSYILGDLAINYLEHRVTVAGKLVELTATEYDTLFELSVNSGRVLSHQHLLQEVWGPENSGDAGLVRTIIKRLRQKLGDDASNPVYIFTLPRVGYRMARAEGLEPENLSSDLQ